MKNPTIKGTFKLKISSVSLHAPRNIGINDTAIIHEALDELKAELDPITRNKFTFERL